MTMHLVVATVLAGACACAGAQALNEIPRNLPAPAQSARSVVFDARSAADARLRNAPSYVETIFVEGRNPDARPPRALEVRFADVLTAPRTSPFAGAGMFSDAPCMSLPSTWNNIGDAHVPLSGCPR
jgi:hypothetical protein